MKGSIRAVTTGSGTEPSSSTASSKARMLNLAPSVFSALAENSFFSVRRFVALLELGELLLRASDVRLVRAAELKELPTKIQLSGIESRLVIFRSRFLSGGARLGNCRGRRVYFWLTYLAGQKTRFQRCQLLLRRNHLRLCQL